ncbi:hypothetical protein [Paenibacillus eucommiae]|uniref:Uncharacterized membrane protein (DUF106 family) n=1 Tax=Paenibacillus eucommiae TaxID=1355755 RepID=A0ABS4IWY9_9BACL|nr:hypothetical protein [Paenibacillus eucommiae]MBP1992070.1 uncharacterized membrane protein (DUF106 family) [Paenibacillus eucommiae]
MQVTKKILTVLTLAAIVSSTAAISSASAADAYAGEISQKQNAVSSLQADQARLTAEIEAAKSSGNSTLAEQKQVQLQQNGATMIQISSMDIETALLMVQSQRTQLLENQLKLQIEEVQKRNQLIVELNTQLAEARKNGDETLVKELQSKIDAAGNSQQMDMLRMQSLSNKRNEAFDVMTNFVKKMQESRASIIGNMR